MRCPPRADGLQSQSSFLVGSQLEWAKRDIVSVELEDRGEAADTFQIIYAVIQLH